MSSGSADSKASFLWKNLLRGLAWFVLLMLVFIAIQDSLEFHYQAFAKTVKQTHTVHFIIFGVSELVLGLIPPEFFMIISILNGISLTGYIQNLMIYTLISYAAGTIAYFTGYRFSNTQLYQRIAARFLGSYEEKIRKYGSYVVFVGAVTPVPFSATCILAGAVKMPFGLFLTASAYRVLRFAVYGFLVWKFPIWFEA